MGDDIEGSSNAARCARHDEEKNGENGRNGVIRRILGAIIHPDAPGQNDRNGDVNYHRHKAQALGKLGGIKVENVAVPKADMVSVPDNISKDELFKVFRESGLTRLPVYKGTLDSPLGMVHLKDFALRHGFNGKGGRFSMQSMLRPLLYVPPSMPIGILLQTMQNDRRHMALVIDEYGGVEGLVTIEDLFEQVVGEIEDEHDPDEDTYWKLEGSGKYIANAKAPIREFEAEIGMSLASGEGVDEEDVDTLGGLVFMLLGRVPVRGELVRHPCGAEIEILDADPRRIKRMGVRLPSAKESSG